MEERKITLVDDDQTLEFYVVEETKLNGANYLLVTDAEDDDEEGDCYILKDMSGAEEADALYEFVEDEDELEGLMKIFAELLDDVDLDKQYNKTMRAHNGRLTRSYLTEIRLSKFLRDRCWETRK